MTQTVETKCHASVNLFVCPMLCMYRILIYLSVCVCPSHFLSIRLQVRPLNGFFTVDSLNDADLRKDVPFRGLDDE